MTDEMETLLSRLEERTNAYDNLLGELAWKPTRSHIETARNLMQDAAKALRPTPPAARSSAASGQIPLGLRGHAKWLRNYRNSPSAYLDPLPTVPDALDGIADDIQELITANSFNEAQLKRANDEIKRLRTVAQPSPDGKLKLFLSILQSAGGEASGNDDKWNWVNYFCDDAEPLDTFNQASKQKFTRVTHDCDSDNSVVYLTDAGRAFIAGTSPISSTNREETEHGKGS